MAVIHDWLTGMRGGEKVLEAILQLVPQAEIFTLFHFPGSVSPQIESHTIHTSPLQRFARGLGDYRRLLPFFPRAIEAWDMTPFDLVISSSHCVAKGVASDAPHVSYCHTPMRYIWDQFDDYFPPSRPLIRFAVNVFAPGLRKWDVATASNVDAFVANSEFVRGRIRRFYDRDAEVVHPFAEGSFFEGKLEDERDDYHAILSALVPYKRIDIALDAARISGKRIVLIGDGPMHDEIKRDAPPNVSLLGFVSTEQIREVLGRARSLIIPGVEDFGITVVEAMASGTPVVAYGEGGALDTVVEGKTGVFFRERTGVSLAAALGEVERNKWDREAIRKHAGRFSREAFLEQFGSVLHRTLG